MKGKSDTPPTVKKKKACRRSRRPGWTATVTLDTPDVYVNGLAIHLRATQ